MKNNFESLHQFRCPKCNRLLFKYKLEGHLSIEITCTRCSSYLKYEIDDPRGTNQL
jgi:phage FluMu protein Com